MTQTKRQAVTVWIVEEDDQGRPRLCGARAWLTEKQVELEERLLAWRWARHLNRADPRVSLSREEALQKWRLWRKNEIRMLEAQLARAREQAAAPVLEEEA